MLHDMPRLDAAAAAGELQIDAFIADKHDTASEILSNTTMNLMNLTIQTRMGGLWGEFEGVGQFGIGRNQSVQITIENINFYPN
ncbi:hypothetical protein M0804_009882 [Polistes exclamans]|nr:hypothetical protein M0804_009882 [Polistes exclamans]